ncbi:MAG: putative ABC transporter permease YknZ [bacterium ADurb.Bin212]|nr:MAG: putative ABC transporter permease YknZ [bacterium ADurb.Bin212]
MSTISRGMRNAFRNGLRTLSITVILAMSIAMALIMLMAMKTVEMKIESVKSSVGNTITVTPAGVRGFEGGGELLGSDDLATIQKTDNVSEVTAIVSERLNSDDTNLESPIEPGSFGERQNNRGYNGGGVPPESSSGDRKFTMPVTVTGIDNLENLSALNMSKLEITAGEKFLSGSEDKIALVGKDLAQKNNLNVGSIFSAFNQEIKVLGLFDAGNTFANAQLIMPILCVQEISGQKNMYNSFIVQVDSVENLDKVGDSISSALEDKADVVSSAQSTESIIKPLENIKSISVYSLIGSVVAGSVIILLTMVMIVRERRREIGVLKAIGSSNYGIVSQFISEALCLTLISSVAGIILGALLSNPVLKVLVNNASADGASGVPGATPGRGMMRMVNAIPGIQNTFRDISAVLDWSIVLYGLVVALLIAIIGSMLPAYFIAKVRPAEVMRSE